MSNSNLNLARKWRPTNFDSVVGQDLSVRILKNALYLNSFFPVYLFSGQRGCGKTSTARIFAAAVNCNKLVEFQKNPKSLFIPCLECASCFAMQNGKHPDFVEIDAASHTGVDNVRQIIEASSFLPLMGNQKIYLIDEAHMLSKAAFNAFLKILEEPPMNVMFILATTDVYKIIDTVRSRCFQLFFTGIDQEILINHLKEICTKESVNFEIEGLRVIVQESDGSVRDAINLLEQVRFSAELVSHKSVLDVLGYLSDESIVKLFKHLIQKSSPEILLKFLEEVNFNLYSAQHTWEILIECLRSAVRAKQEVNSNFSKSLEIKEIIIDNSLDDILFIMEEFCTGESIFLKTLNKHAFLELLFLRILKGNGNKSLGINLNHKSENISKVDLKDEPVKIQDNNWNNFVKQMSEINEPFISSIFSQANYIGYNSNINEVTISFNKKSNFFKEMINDKSDLWKPVLSRVFRNDAKLNIIVQEPTQVVVEEKIIDNQKRVVMNKNDSIDISDTSKWQVANMLLKKFSGTIKEVKSDE